jgi:hypothetical protein
MARIRSSAWTTILMIAGVLLIIGMLVSGYIIWGIALLLLVLALGGGALLYRSQGPPAE